MSERQTTERDFAPLFSIQDSPLTSSSSEDASETAEAPAFRGIPFVPRRLTPARVYNLPTVRETRRRVFRDIPVVPYPPLSEDLRRLGEGKRYFIFTYGCLMNVRDSETAAGLLESMGFSPAADPAEADVVLLNTCAIRENAEERVFGELGRLKGLKRTRHELIVGVMGCMPQEEGVARRLLEEHPEVDLVLGTHNLHLLPTRLAEAILDHVRVFDVWNREGELIEALPANRSDRIKAYVNISYGCDEFCTYCIVPYTRGRERSRRPEDVLQEVRELAEAGYREVTLLGQNVNAYGKDFRDRVYTFADLLADIQEISIPWVRFTTSHPRDFDRRTIEVLARGGNLVEHVHLPVQSGSDAVLRRMNRRYTREWYLELVRELRAHIPGVALTTDIIVGFPGETEADFEATLSLVEEVSFDGAFTFIYSPREGTPAARFPDETPYEVKRARLERLNEVVRAHALRHNEELLGRSVTVLVEGPSKRDGRILAARTRTNKLVHFEGPPQLAGEFVRVRIERVQPYTLYGTYVGAAAPAEVEVGG
ncbi:MAG: tRNA (N6-isopentenyl adenosine(37)-C2)-methylthiotransferase MiaB [Brockia lithotrophica]|nr:tRNA (N6-isopentenyl adenosine(37)-C2)-methylthiotransferase MiaB [Brockia lithotrophica]